VPGPDQLVPNHSRESEISFAAIVDEPDLFMTKPVSGDADPARAVFVPLLPDPRELRDLVGGPNVCPAVGFLSARLNTLVWRAREALRASRERIASA
jgi:hypothetical protein